MQEFAFCLSLIVTICNATILTVSVQSSTFTTNEACNTKLIDFLYMAHSYNAAGCVINF